jgi:hypothetical protein
VDNCPVVPELSPVLRTETFTAEFLVKSASSALLESASSYEFDSSPCLRVALAERRRRKGAGQLRFSPCSGGTAVEGCRVPGSHSPGQRHPGRACVSTGALFPHALTMLCGYPSRVVRCACASAASGDLLRQADTRDGCPSGPATHAGPVDSSSGSQAVFGLLVIL